jgi:hypothetical protein
LRSAPGAPVSPREDARTLQSQPSPIVSKLRPAVAPRSACCSLQAGGSCLAREEA